MSDEHRRGGVSNNFCTAAGTPCGCNNNYVTPCESEADGWGDYPQKYTVKNKATKLIEELRQNRRCFEAHHILPVACVSETVLAWDKEKNADPSVVTGTKWCINVADNMIALPMWGHTIIYYCDNFKAVSDEVAAEVEKSLSDSKGKKRVAGLSAGARQELAATVTDRNDTAPPFKDRVQHNYGHTGKSPETGYNQEVVKKLKDIVIDVENAQDAHATDKVNSLKGELDQISTDMRELLEERSTRVHGGTHQAWKAGMNDKQDWYKCFAMTAKPTKMDFPLGRSSGAMVKKLAELAQAMWMDN